MMRRNHLFQKVQDLYGSPSGFSEERRKAFYRLEKSPSDIKKELTSIEKDVDANFYVLACGNDTIISMDV